MESFASTAWAEIISKAAVSPLGIAALALLIVGFVILRLVPPNDKPRFRLIVILVFMLFCGGLMAASIYSVRPTALPQSAATDVQTEGPSHQLSNPTSATPSSSLQPPGGTPATASVTTASSPPIREDCGTAWSGWTDVGVGVGNPCRSACTRGTELGQSYRVVGFPPRPQTKHKFQCWRE